MGYNYFERGKTSAWQADGRVVGRIRPGVKMSHPSEGETDYRFFIEPLSPLPQGFEEAVRKGYFFTGFMNQLGYGLNAFSSEEDAERVLMKAYGDSFITFTPLIRNYKYYVAGDIEKEYTTPLLREESSFIAVPVFGDDTSPVFGGDVNKFCSHLLEGKPLPGLPKKYWDSNEHTPFVIADIGHFQNAPSRYMYFAPLKGDTFEESLVGEGGAYFRFGRDSLCYGFINLNDDRTGRKILRTGKTPLWFIPREVVPLIKETAKPVPQNGDIEKAEKITPLGREEIVLYKPAEAEGKEEKLSPQELLDRTVREMMADSLKDKKPAEDKKEEIRIEKPESTEKEEPEIPEEQKTEESEKAFISRFASHVRQRGYLYDRKDLINFHVAMKSSKLVILAGMSGTGKSRLVHLYGEALGLPEERVAFLPVRPSWMDDGDILGYLDREHMIYRPADTGLSELLIEAAANRDRLYIVCFDEMNLARAEYYFAQFISVLENEENPVVRLYNPALTDRVYNSSRYPAEIPVGDNFLFTGTVNVDESTYHFSDKILDRANVITLKQGRFSDMEHLRRQAAEREPEISAEVYNAFRKDGEEIHLTRKELEFLDAVNDAFAESGVLSGIGYRVVFEINQYLDNIPEGTGFDRRTGFDREFVQRILTKIRGSAEQLRRLVALTDDGRVSGSLAGVLSRYPSVSDFTETRKALAAKARELALYDYTI